MGANGDLSAVSEMKLVMERCEMSLSDAFYKKAVPPAMGEFGEMAQPRLGT